MDGVWNAPRERSRHFGPHYAISGLGLLFLLLWSWYALSTGYFTLRSPHLAEESVLVLKAVETLVMVSMAGALLYAGYWFNANDLSRTQELWGAIWTMIGSMGIVSVVLVMNAHQMIGGFTVTPRVLAEEILLGGAGGGIAGLLIGMETSRTMDQANRLSKQRNAFAFLNRLLRHNLLNALTVIQGKAIRLSDDVPDRYNSDIRAIRDRSESISDLATQIRDFADVLSGEGDLVRVDVSESLHREVATARSSFPEAEFEVSIPESCHVHGHPALGGVFDNLLSNAVNHHDRDAPHVSVSIEEAEETVDVRIADDGPGVEDERKASIFELDETGDHGMGLFLVDTIVAYCGGEVRVTDNEPRGAVFTVSLLKQPP